MKGKVEKRSSPAYALARANRSAEPPASTTSTSMNRRHERRKSHACGSPRSGSSHEMASRRQTLRFLLDRRMADADQALPSSLQSCEAARRSSWRSSRSKLKHARWTRRPTRTMQGQKPRGVRQVDTDTTEIASCHSDGLDGSRTSVGELKACSAWSSTGSLGESGPSGTSTQIQGTFYQGRQALADHRDETAELHVTRSPADVPRPQWTRQVHTAAGGTSETAESTEGREIHASKTRRVIARQGTTSW